MDTATFTRNQTERLQALEDAVNDIIEAHGTELEPRDVFRNLPRNVGGSYAETAKIYRRLTAGAEVTAPVMWVTPPAPRTEKRPPRGLERLASWVEASEKARGTE